MKRPAFQFYPADWQANSNLRRCTHEEKGIWIDVMCLLHDQGEYGIIRWPLKEISQAVGCSLAKLKALTARGILKGADSGAECDEYVFIPTCSGRRKGDPVTLIHKQEGPLWYSSRMVLDEHKRMVRGELNTPPKQTPNYTPNPPLGAAPKVTPDPSPSRAGASSSSTSTSKSYSEANASGDMSPKIIDPDEIIFGYGVPILVNAGNTEKASRSFLGGLRKQHGDTALIDKLRDCIKEKPLQPLEWLAKALPPTSRGTPLKTPAPDNFSAKDYGSRAMI